MTLYSFVTETNRYYAQMHRKYKRQKKNKKVDQYYSVGNERISSIKYFDGSSATMYDYWSTRLSIATPFFSEIMT